jgi:hypothetical protein
MALAVLLESVFEGVTAIALPPSPPFVPGPPIPFRPLMPGNPEMFNVTALAEKAERMQTSEIAVEARNLRIISPPEVIKSISLT